MTQLNVINSVSDNKASVAIVASRSSTCTHYKCCMSSDHTRGKQTRRWQVACTVRGNDIFLVGDPNTLYMDPASPFFSDRPAKFT